MKRAALCMLPGLLWSVPSAQACAVCFGAKGDPVTEAMGWAILFLVVVIGGVLLSLGLFFFQMNLRARHLMPETDVL